jgi:hypothetical protein
MTNTTGNIFGVWSFGGIERTPTPARVGAIVVIISDR